CRPAPPTARGGRASVRERRPTTIRRNRRPPRVSHQPLPPGAEAVELLILDADGVLTDGLIWIDEKGGQMRRYSIRDGLAIGAWTRLGFKLAIVSGRRGADLDERAKAMGVDIVIQGVEDKGKAVADLLERLEVDPAHAAFLGDDVQDT